MTAIVGCVGRAGSASPESLCHTMLEALAAYGPDAASVVSFERGAFGRALLRTLPEDDFDRQPVPVGAFLVAADARIDNRDELRSLLGLAAGSQDSDAGLLAAAWERWGLKSLQQIVGDFSVAIWDREERALTLARSPLALKPLFYSVQPGLTAFASLPQGLLAIKSVPRELNSAHAAALVAHCNAFGSTMFKGIEPVHHGCAVRLTRSGEQRIPLWEPTPRHAVSSRDFPEALREEFERAVAARLRRPGGAVAAQLSAGRDSSAVATTAALILARRGEELLAFTGAPFEGFQLPDIPDRLMDESAFAALTAQAHANIRHFVCRAGKESVVPLLEPQSASHFGPLLNPANLYWWNKIDECASAAGASVLLVGSAGNFTISAGGMNHLPDLLQERGVAAFLRESVAIGGHSVAAWQTIAHLIMRPAMPAWMYRLIMKASGRWSNHFLNVPLLRQPYRKEAEQLLEQQRDEHRRIGSLFELRRKMLLDSENAEIGTVATWRMDVRDPTADRRVVELCFSAPVEEVVSARTERPGYEAAFSDRIPAQVLRNKPKGLQAVDWFEAFPKADVEAAFRKYARNPLVDDLLDFPHINRLIEDWPATGWGPLEQVVTYRNDLLGALAVAAFIDCHFPN